MSTFGLVVIMLIVIGSVTVSVLVAIAVSGVIEANRIRREPLVRDARRAVVAALSGEENTDEAVASLNRFSERHVIKVLLDLAPSVMGTSRAVLVSLADRMGVLQRARHGISNRKWATRLYSSRVLTAFGVESPELGTLLRDRSSDVRAQAAAWSVVMPEQAAIVDLIGLLADPDGLCRFAAQDALIRIGLPATGPLLHALETADAEVTERILTVAAAMGDERFAAQAARLTTDRTPSVRALAAAVLGRIGDTDAGPSLVSLLGDDEVEVLFAATAALAKLSYWPAAADVERLLSHPQWELRKQAALALVAFGAPGLILLSVAATGEGMAADMATQALQVQSVPTEVNV
jgi:HEAT repeat protein